MQDEDHKERARERVWRTQHLTLVESSVRADANTVPKQSERNFIVLIFQLTVKLLSENLTAEAKPF